MGRAGREQLQQKGGARAALPCRKDGGSLGGRDKSEREGRSPLAPSPQQSFIPACPPPSTKKHPPGHAPRAGDLPGAGTVADPPGDRFCHVPAERCPQGWPRGARGGRRAGIPPPPVAKKEPQRGCCAPELRETLLGGGPAARSCRRESPRPGWRRRFWWHGGGRGQEKPPGGGTSPGEAPRAPQEVGEGGGTPLGEGSGEGGTHPAAPRSRSAAGLPRGVSLPEGGGSRRLG